MPANRLKSLFAVREIAVDTRERVSAAIDVTPTRAQLDLLDAADIAVAEIDAEVEALLARP
jgi:hypothetical protein